MAKLDLKDKKKLLRTMLMSRAGDLREQSLIRQGKGWFHVSGMGHEALSVAGYLLKEGDFHVGHYRDRPIALARGIENYELALSFYAKRACRSSGRQMPAHYSSRELGVFSISSVVGVSALPAAGLAWSIKLDNKPNVVTHTIGDAGTRQGDYFEALAFALERQLPMVFIVEDNGIGISTITKKMNPLSIGLLDRSIWKSIDGCDVDAVYDVVHPAIEKARAGEGPQFIWCRTERISSHSSADDHRRYRPQQELAELEEKDPVNRLRDDLISMGELTLQTFEKLRTDIDREVRADYARAEDELDPHPEDLLKNVLGPSTKAPSMKLDVDHKNCRMVDSINATFRSAIQKSREVIFFGQDIEDPKGGVFSLTKGLSSLRPEQVYNSPLAESTICGVSVGMAAYGKRPIFEIQFADFIWPGFNQLITQLSTLHWRTNGEWSAPAVIYAPYGAYLPGGALWHSQSNEGALAHFPGLKIAIPSRPEDAAGIFWTALHGHSPCLILIPKHLMWLPREIKGPIQPVPFGKALMRNAGDKLTVVTWGNGTEVVEQAMEILDDPGCIDFIDLRTVVPLDLNTIRKSVQKTGRLLVVQEDVETCSIGQHIITRISADPEFFTRMLAPPALMGRPDVNIGYNPVLEYAALPDKHQVARKMQALMTDKIINQRIAEKPREIKNPVLEIMKESLADESVDQQTDTIAVKVPMLGEGITSAKVISLISKPGDNVNPDDPLCEVETDKALFPIESSSAGRLKKWLIEEGNEVEVDQVVAEIEVRRSRAQEPVVVSRKTKPSAQIIEKLTWGGLPAHVIAQLKNVVPAHMTVMADWSSIQQARIKAKTSMGKSAPSPTVMVAWCMVQAMKKHSVFRCTVNQNDELGHNDSFDFGIAVALQEDAIDTAIIPNADQLDGSAFTVAYAEAVEAARKGQMRSKAKVPLILTSMGGYSVREALPVVVPPSIATLFLGEAHWEKRSETAHAQQSALCLSFDHRWLNGAAGANFLQDVKKEMERFSLEMIAGT